MSNCIFFFFYRKKPYKNKVPPSFLFGVYVNFFADKFVEILKSISIILFLVCLKLFIIFRIPKNVKIIDK